MKRLATKRFGRNCCTRWNCVASGSNSVNHEGLANYHAAARDGTALRAVSNSVRKSRRRFAGWGSRSSRFPSGTRRGAYRQGKKIRWRDGVEALATLWRWRKWKPSANAVAAAQAGASFAESRAAVIWPRTKSARGSRGESRHVPSAALSAGATAEIAEGAREVRWSPRCVGAGLILVLIIHTVLLAWGAWQHSASWDEVGHLAAGLSHWESGTFDLYRVNPPLVRMVATLPVVVLRPETEWHRFPSDARWCAEWAFGREFFQANGERSLQYLALARWTCIPFSLLGAWTCFRWARDLYGQAAGMMAATLWCLSPNILGNAQMITPDTASAALGVTSAAPVLALAQSARLDALSSGGRRNGFGRIDQDDAGRFLPVMANALALLAMDGTGALITASLAKPSHAIGRDPRAVGVPNQRRLRLRGHVRQAGRSPVHKRGPERRGGFSRRRASGEPILRRLARLSAATAS